MAAPTCPCDGTVMERGVRPMTITYKGRQLSIDMPGHYCPACGEGVHGGGDLKISDRALNRLKADVEGLLPPDGVRRIRRRLGRGKCGGNIKGCARRGVLPARRRARPMPELVYAMRATHGDDNCNNWHCIY